MLQTTLPAFRQPEFAVVRQHEEFVWLHDRFEENEEYGGIVVRSFVAVFLLFLGFFSQLFCDCGFLASV